MEKFEQPTEEQITDVCTQLRYLLVSRLTLRLERLLALSGITFPLRWLELKALRVALRTAFGIASGWCKQPTGLFVQTLKNGVFPEQAEASVANKEYPRPTLEQLDQLGEMGELVYTGLNEPGSPSVVAVNTGSGILPWWAVLKVEVA